MTARSLDRARMLRPRERRLPVMPNQLPMVVEERIVAFSLGHPGLGPKRIAAQLARPEWGGLVVSPNGVWKVLRRHGISTRAKRLSLIAGYRAPYEPPAEPEAEPTSTSSDPESWSGSIASTAKKQPCAFVISPSPAYRIRNHASIAIRRARIVSQTAR
jgi:hypothetical protein